MESSPRDPTDFSGADDYSSRINRAPYWNSVPEMSDHAVTDKNQEFIQCFSRCQGRIYAFIFSLLPNANDADDVLQQASMELWKNFSRYDPNREFFPWACGVAYRVVLTHRRSAARSRLVFCDELIEHLADDHLSRTREAPFRAQLLEECIAYLKEKDRKLLNQIYREGMAAKETLASDNRAVQTVYNRLNFIRKKLMDCVNRKMATGS